MKRLKTINRPPVNILMFKYLKFLTIQNKSATKAKTIRPKNTIAKKRKYTQDSFDKGPKNLSIKSDIIYNTNTFKKIINR